ncbi:hypothetical protein CFBP1573P_00643 [Pseudomonas syringae pv. persicae]|uniref:Uncharacterized protein n=1 Tax=Pseudomonas syringae pv. persicae TaxID=237306 RepID=A0AB38EAH2_9PSED|nr:hypothetical protein NCPPB2254_00557 [Pseudomonas syringae pv. persicae]SOQ05878.1 hypothetical protein CFBP1573P_00643 [Pseudomonas syringae pv. persicae]
MHALQNSQLEFVTVTLPPFLFKSGWAVDLISRDPLTKAGKVHIVAMRNIPQTCLAGTILFHGCEFCLLCVFTHDASKGCIQPSGVTPERRNDNLNYPAVNLRLTTSLIAAAPRDL